MKILHKVKTGKVNEIPLDGLIFTTRHVEEKGKVHHEGWAISGAFLEKSHQYTLIFSPEEAREFHTWLEKMLPRFDTENIQQFITNENHD